MADRDSGAASWWRSFAGPGGGGDHGGVVGGEGDGGEGDGEAAAVGFGLEAPAQFLLAATPPETSRPRAPKASAAAKV